jgi:hypothetical protein
MPRRTSRIRIVVGIEDERRGGAVLQDNLHLDALASDGVG